MIVQWLASFLTGIAASMGMGGGFILVVYLTLYEQIAQRAAQGINLLFFIGTSLVSVAFHYKHKLLELSAVVFSLISGLPFVWIGCVISEKLGSERLRPMFAVFVLLIGLRELKAGSKKSSPNKKDTTKGDASKD